MKVLIVDDSPQALALAKARLAPEEHELMTAESAKAGIEIARRQEPDLILLDVKMPDMSGFEACRRIKEDPELALIPVIFLTGSDDVEDKVVGLRIGAVDYVTKPFDPFELRARVAAALRTKRLQDLLNEQARLDPLTEMPNRRALHNRLEEEWERVQRHGRSLSFIIADLDHFKSVNDKHGHNIGDSVLRDVASTMRSRCRRIDLPCRYGGEEFAVIVPDETAEGAAVLAERYRGAIAELRFTAADEEFSITASFGVAEAAGADSPEALIELADNALYQAKENGRNQVVIAS